MAGGGQTWVEDGATTPTTVTDSSGVTHTVRPEGGVDASTSTPAVNPYLIDPSTGLPYTTGSFPGDPYAGYGYENKNNNVDAGHITFGINDAGFGSVMDDQGGFSGAPNPALRSRTGGRGLSPWGGRVNRANSTGGMGLLAFAAANNRRAGGRG